jgi:hypothetical protein
MNGIDCLALQGRMNGARPDSFAAKLFAPGAHAKLAAGILEQ